jgi:hypothetical protein
MKYFSFLLLFLGFSNGYTQTVAFKEIRLKPKATFYRQNNYTITYPIIVTQSASIDKRINDKIKQDFIDPDEEKISIRQALNNWVNDGLINLSYETTFKKNGVLSIKIYAEGCGAHCTSWDSYFTFDLKTGKCISIQDLFVENKLDSLREIIRNDKIEALKKYKKEQVENLSKNEIDSATYNMIIEQVENNCINEVEIETFSLSDQDIVFIDPCEFPNAMRPMEPDYILKYSYKFLCPFLKPVFQKRLSFRCRSEDLQPQKSR